MTCLSPSSRGDRASGTIIQAPWRGPSERLRRSADGETFFYPGSSIAEARREASFRKGARGIVSARWRSIGALWFCRRAGRVSWKGFRSREVGSQRWCSRHVPHFKERMGRRRKVNRPDFHRHGMRRQRAGGDGALPSPSTACTSGMSSLTFIPCGHFSSHSPHPVQAEALSPSRRKRW